MLVDGQRQQGPLAQSGAVVLHDPTARRWLLFQDAHRICRARSAADVPDVLREIQQEIDLHGCYAAGFLSYEAAPGFDPAFVVRTGDDFPAAWFGLYKEPQVIAGPEWDLAQADPAPWDRSMSREEYEGALCQIRRYIQQGDTYQVNYSMRLHSQFAGDPWALFGAMVQAQGPHYAAFINLEDWAVCCASPELFFRLDHADLVCRPMKGTARRGLWLTQDLQQSADLHRSEKNRAENVMIVDMVRNDLGRVAHPGSVCVENLFQVEKYPTLWQMTSTVCCRTAAAIPEIFHALFPAASITGAPKIRTMQIIAGLEQSPRRIYTGSIGFIAPYRQAQFNVAIRTVLIDKRRAVAEYGVGGGIVWDSAPAAEFEECQTKARVVTRTMPEFSLLETILWTPETGFSLLDLHLQRLAESADYFSRPFDLQAVRQRLDDLARHLPPQSHRVRLLLSREGVPTLESHLFSPAKPPSRLRLAPLAVNSQDVFLYHKTTYRGAYDQALAACPGYDDVLLWNERREITESSIANVAVEKDGEWLTPRLECGLLPGTYRAFLLKQKRIREGIIRVEDLAPCSKIFLFNSLRGIWEVPLPVGPL